MKSLKNNTTLLLASLLTLSLQGCGNSSDLYGKTAPSKSSVTQPGDNAEGDIFSDDSMNEEQTDQVEEVQGNQIQQKRFVKVNLQKLKRALEGSSRSVTFNMFEGKPIKVQFDDVNKVSETNFVATGHIQGDLDSSATLVINNEVVALTIKGSDDETNYEVKYTGTNGRHLVLEQVELGDGEGACETVTAPQQTTDEPIVNTEELMETPLAAPVINILVAYTPAARAKVGGTTAMKALIQLGIADTNTAMKNSGTNLQVRLAGTLETRQNESSNYSSDLNALRSSTDSKWNEIHAARAKYKADQVTMIGAYTNVSNPVGIGFYRATKSYAFTIVKYSVISSMFTLAHELGHNIGLAHEDGYVNSTGKFRTIMAYGTYKRIRRYSNPNIAYNGYKTGTLSKYSAKIINNNAIRMSGLIP